MSATAKIAIVPKLIPVFSGKADVRGAFGGRGSGKTMTFAKMTAVRAHIWDQAGRDGAIVCGREHLNSLDDSSMAEVKAAILSEPWLAPHFDIGEKYIRTRSKRISYKFSGMDKGTIDSLKSKSKILLLWADEAEPITDGVWDTVIPTLRQEDSELWVTWNPKRKSSATDRRFRQTTDPLMKVVECNWRDNPRFPAILERQRQKWLRTDPDSYDHVWEGAYATAIKGAYFTRQLADMRQTGRLGKMAWDPLMRRRLFVDIGGTGRNSDAFCMWGAQFIGREVRVMTYYEQVGQEIGHHLRWMEKRGFKPENTSIWLPHDGETHDKVFSVSYESAFQAAGYPVEVVPNQGKGAAISRIQALRRVFPSMWFNDADIVLGDDDTGNTVAAGLEALGWYHEKWDEERDVGLGPEHDWASHGCLVAGTMVETTHGQKRIEDVRVGDQVLTPSGPANVSWSGQTAWVSILVRLVFDDGTSLTATPRHVLFTTRGLVRADAVSNNDAIFTPHGAPKCTELGIDKHAGYRDAFSENFLVSGIGSGNPVVCTAPKSAESRVSFTGFCLRQTMAAWLRRAKTWCLLMATSIRVDPNSARRVVSSELLTVESVPVYDLTVDVHHCYVANGVLVSNSDAAGLLAIVAEDHFRNSGVGLKRDSGLRRRGSPMAV